MSESNNCTFSHSLEDISKDELSHCMHQLLYVIPGRRFFTLTPVFIQHEMRINWVNVCSFLILPSVLNTYVCLVSID
jgi:hypothetical protein